MKKVMTVAVLTLMMAGSSAFACSGCGCSAKKAEKAKTECKACDKDKACKACDAKAKKAEKKAACDKK
ncbi:hypothetical protein [Pontiella agarivorans]|uniref:Uncharacterized protein n=1 Tax=Pontiella agarivorans TaxID=3038953 RepID=A0ABU5MVV8_9BACT|nr:hypothetical protein [Pontiella agarivorans]MDZ8118355.1 hypothetical protein [Pontiella agarivorans]